MFSLFDDAFVVPVAKTTAAATEADDDDCDDDTTPIWTFERFPKLVLLVSVIPCMAKGSTLPLEVVPGPGGVAGMLLSSSNSEELKSVKSELEKLGVDDSELEEVEEGHFCTRGLRLTGVTGAVGRAGGVGME